MHRRRLVLIAMPALAMAIASCGGTAEGLAPVTGKLLCDGQPAAGAVLLFHRRAGEPAPPPSAAAGVIPSATVGDDGSFAVESGTLGRGAPPGRYGVLVQWPEGGDAPPGAARAGTANVKGKKVVVAKHDELAAVPADRLKGRYADVARPRLEAEVKPGPNDLGTLEITLK